MTGKLENQVAIVTGAGAGIGAATARLFVAEGAAVTVAELNEAAALATARDIELAGGRALAVTADVSKGDEAKRVVDRTLGEFGTIDVLVNNAGVELKKPVEETTEEEWVGSSPST